MYVCWDGVVYSVFGVLGLWLGICFASYRCLGFGCKMWSKLLLAAFGVCSFVLGFSLHTYAVRSNSWKGGSLGLSWSVTIWLSCGWGDRLVFVETIVV